MPLHPNRAGFAMPMVILVIGFMTAAVLAAFTRSGVEFQLVDNHQLQTDAFAVAEAGLQSFIANGRTNPATATYTFANGTAVVTAIRMRPMTDTEEAKWLIRSVGTVTAVRTGPPARRTVAQFATMPRSGMDVSSALMSLSGVDKAGTSGSFSGVDQCGVEGDVSGAEIPSGGYWTGHSDMTYGDPPIDSTLTQAQLIAQTPIDWAGIIDPTSPAIVPDIVICGTGATGLWGTCGTWPSFADPDYWPVIVVDGTVDLRQSDLAPTGIGRGTLIVTKNLGLLGGADWDGILLVGGLLTDNGTGSSDGATIAGLNLLIPGETVGGYSADLNGTKRYQFNSCNVANASQSFVRMVPITNAWVDNWTNW
ncbi:MAG TPA: hypothetical protein VK928_09950 [Longimicrobiales bacterium]|nr:hypothetical protein [Longimicrobiales bacterium]